MSDQVSLTEEEVRKLTEDELQKMWNLVAVATYIACHDEDDEAGEYTRDEALQAFANIVGIPRHSLMDIATDGEAPPFLNQ